MRLSASGTRCARRPGKQYPDPYYQGLWYGDNVQFFLAGTGTRTGEYLGSDDGGATHIIVSPPASADDTAEAVQLFESSLGTVSTYELPSTEYAARLVPDGYEVEVRIPWSQYADTMTSGGRIGFDVIVGTSDSSGYGLQLEGGLANNPVANSVCATTRTHPGCDDRTWCTPALQ
jgi:hypothetical protein